MATLRQARAFALALPEAAEQDHHGFPSFRVAGKIFATVPDALHLHLMLDEPEVRMTLEIAPKAFEELWWGERLAGLRVTLKGADPRFLSDLILLAWKRRAPRHALAALDAAMAKKHSDPGKNI